MNANATEAKQEKREIATSTRGVAPKKKKEKICLRS